MESRFFPPVQNTVLYVPLPYDQFLLFGKKATMSNLFVRFSQFTSGPPLIGFFDFGEKSPAKAGKLVFVGQKTFCPTRTQLALFAWTENPHKFGLPRNVYTKRVFSDQILFQYPLLKRSITAWFSVSIRTSGDIWWHLMSPMLDLAASAILLQRDIKTVSCPVTGISPCRRSDSSCYWHSIMMLCQYVKRKMEDRIASMGVSHDKLRKCRDPVKMVRYRQTAFLHSSGTALDRRGAGMFSRWHDSFMIWETIGTRSRRD